ncbi:MAG: hypothetical protein WA354_11250 [Terracidiphilus sp.]
MDKIELTSVVVNPEKKRGLSRSGRAATRLSPKDLQSQFTRILYLDEMQKVSNWLRQTARESG